MTKTIKNSGSGWSGDDPNAWKQIAIEVSLANYKESKDPICLAQIIRCVDFKGFDEAQEIIVKYLLDTTRRNTKYTDALLWKNIADMYFRLERHPDWVLASHEALSNYIYHKLGEIIQSKNELAFAKSLAGYVKKYR